MMPPWANEGGTEAWMKRMSDSETRARIRQEMETPTLEWENMYVSADPATIQDHATFEDPHQYSTGMMHVFVNGEQVIKDGEHTGATPGRFVRGPGWQAGGSDG